jgi:hypothetical protein
MPALVCAMPNDLAGPRFTHEMMRVAFHSEAMLHGIFFATITFDRIIRAELEQSELELRLQTLAVQHLRQQLSNPSTAIDAANIWPIVIFSYLDSKLALRTGKLPSRVSAFQELQSLHILGRMSTSKMHRQGLANLVQQLGGLHAVRPVGMASMITL